MKISYTFFVLIEFYYKLKKYI